MYIADQLNKFSLSREGLEKHRKKRQKREDEANRQRHLERQEELALRREEERRSQYQSWGRQFFALVLNWSCLVDIKLILLQETTSK